MIQWLVKAYGRTGKYTERERVVLDITIPAPEVPNTIARAIEMGAGEILVIEVRASANKGVKHMKEDW